MKKKTQKRRRLLKMVLLTLLIGALSLTVFTISVILGFWEPLPSKEQLADIRQSEASEIYGRNGELLGKYFIYDRQPVAFKDLPKHLIDATVATEDARFYEHNGIDQRSLLRVAIKSILMGDDSAGGGSTISQQLIKNLFPRKSHGLLTMPVNKIKEAYLATQLEELYSKEEILTLYFNTVPFGDNTFGVESAAEKFFSVRTKDLSLEQSAVIVGMLKASYLYNPRLFPERSLARRNTVLTQMEKYGYLTNEERVIATKAPLSLSYQPFAHDQGLAPYFRAQLQQKLTDWLADYNAKNDSKLNLFTSGLQIETTLDTKLQAMAEKAIQEHMAALQKAFEQSYGKNAPWLKSSQIIENAISGSKHYKKLQNMGLTSAQIDDSLRMKRQIELWDWNGKQVVQASTIDSVQHYLKLLNSGMISLAPRSGEILAWVGGINYEYFQYDHVVQAKRQVGSTFKPIVYAAALENGLSPCAYIPAQSMTYANYDDWTPINSGDIDPEKSYAVKAALAQSINTIAVKVLEKAEVSNIIQLAEDLGIETEIPPVPSIALGTPEISMMEMAKAYTAFINEGRPSDPYFLKSIRDKNGNLLASFEPDRPNEQVLSSQTSDMMIEMMKSVVEEGTAQRLRWKYGLENDIAGKTGTTQNNKDGWFVALTPQLITLTWVGADDHRIGFKTTAMGQGANSALPIYALFQQQMNLDRSFDRYTDAQFPPPSVKVSKAMNCDLEKEPSFLKKIFTNAEEPKISGLKIDTVSTEQEKPGLFKRIGGLFKKKKKNN